MRNGEQPSGRSFKPTWRAYFEYPTIPCDQTLLIQTLGMLRSYRLANLGVLSAGFRSGAHIIIIAVNSQLISTSPLQDT